MDQTILILSCLLLILLQVFHIFEEIAGRAYELAGSLRKYLLVASLLVTLNVLFLALIVLDLRAGYILGLIGSTIAIGNGLAHLIGYAKTRSYRQGIGAGLFTGLPLALVGAAVLVQLVRALVT